MANPKTSNRRNFLKGASLLTAGMAAAPFQAWAQGSVPQPADSIYQIGPQEGYSPHIGTLLSTMTMMRTWVLRTVSDLSQKELDFQFDKTSNSIGAMLLHLAATERYYQLNTFEGLDWGTWDEKIKEEWDVPMGLGKKARKVIKGYDLDYYLEKLESVRAHTKEEFAKRGDDWLMQSEPFFDGKPTNNYCKWFHVCEHESNHNGQIKFLLKRIR